MNLKPLGNHIILAAANKEAITALGIIIPDTADKERPERGTVVAVGPGKMLENGTRQAIDVKVGDEIVFKKYAPDEIELKNPAGESKKFLIVNADEVLAVIEN
ncbi:MAG: co-chaperone GroES [Patescibacteria group bacterium]